MQMIRRRGIFTFYLHYFTILIVFDNIIFDFLFFAFSYNAAMKLPSPSHTYADNRKARFDYEVIEEFEAGIRLYGEEVKSIRKGSINLRGSYILITNGYPSLVGVHISEYPGGMRKLEPHRERELLMRLNEFTRYESKIKEM